jgi:hypothetical protein
MHAGIRACPSTRLSIAHKPPNAAPRAQVSATRVLHKTDGPLSYGLHVLYMIYCIR